MSEPAVLCACRDVRVLTGCPKHDPFLGPPLGEATIQAGRLVLDSTFTPPAWMVRSFSPTGTVDSCMWCKVGVMTRWPATADRVSENAREFARTHQCTKRAEPGQS